MITMKTSISNKKFKFIGVCFKSHSGSHVHQAMCDIKKDWHCLQLPTKVAPDFLVLHPQKLNDQKCLMRLLVNSRKMKPK